MSDQTLLRGAVAALGPDFDTAELGLALADLDGTVLRVNRALADLAGTGPADLLGMDLDAVLQQVGGGVHLTARTVESEAGEPLCTLVEARPTAASDQRVVRPFIDEQVRRLAEAAPIGLLVADVDGTPVMVNRRWREITGIEASTPIPVEVLAETIHPEDLPGAARRWEASADAGEPLEIRTRLILPDDRVRAVDVRANPLPDREGEVAGYFATWVDVTEDRATEDMLRRLATIVESTSDVVGVVDARSGEVLFLNPAALELLGVAPGDEQGLTSADLYAESAFERYAEEILPSLRAGETWTGELTMLQPGGREISVLQSVAAEYSTDGKVTRVSAVGRDVTEQKQAEAELAYRATHDQLTGLPNRTLLVDRLEQALARSERDDSVVALIFLDLDGLKAVNDSLGHDAGDELLLLVGRRISAVLRPSDTVARLGGDEFVVLCEPVHDENHAVSIGQRVAAAVSGRPFAVGGARLPITTSAGIALSTSADLPEALLRSADAAMYRAKDRGGARLEVFDEEMRSRSALRIQLAEQLSSTVGQGGIDVHYQPAVDLRHGKVVAVEALARWNHPTRGLLHPPEFVPVAEETGLIVGLGLLVIRDACEQASRWRDLGRTNGSTAMHVNLSARQLSYAELPMLVDGVLDAVGLEPELLCLEVSESVLMDDPSATLTALEGLRKVGVRLAVDNFGSGYISLRHLRRFPLDMLKLDRSFVEPLGSDPNDSTVAAAIVGLAHALGLQAVAEGVETTDQLRRIREMGYDAAQGHLFSHPRPGSEVDDLVAATYPI